MLEYQRKFNWKSLPEMFFKEAEKHLDKPLLSYKTNNQYK